MTIVQLIKRGEEKVRTLKYKTRLKNLETALRGDYADMIIVHNLKMKDCPEYLIETMGLVVKPKRGIVIFMEDMPMERLARL